MCRYLTVVALTILLWLPLTSHAAVVSGLYEAEVAVADQAETTRRQALREALTQVLVKLTGDSEVAGRSDAKALLDDAERYLQQYRYQEYNEKTAAGESERHLFLWAVFDARTLDEAVRRAGLPTWGRERPASLVWLVVEDDSGRQLVGLEQGVEYLEPLERAAKARALPLLIPLLDLEDTANLRPDAVWDGSGDAIRRASERYSAEVILAARLQAVGTDSFEVRWIAFLPNDRDEWSSRGETLYGAFSNGIQPYGDKLAARFAPRTPIAEAGRLMLTVTAVNSLDDYARAETYLNSLSNVVRVEIRGVAPGEVTFEVEAAGGDRALEQAIALGRTLRPESGGDGRQYRLLP
jgi:uncharacterized protein